MIISILARHFDALTLDQLGTVSGGRHCGERKHSAHKRRHHERSAQQGGQDATGLAMASGASDDAATGAVGDDSGAAPSAGTPPGPGLAGVVGGMAGAPGSRAK
ncbi:MAG TPA: hypothetical protein VHW23_11045 [Kofleriaceae bacterium]|jgi:hypothetical protein|nr:hypothetical protein [Kofleriaceae bacterium]